MTSHSYRPTCRPQWCHILFGKS